MSGISIKLFKGEAPRYAPRKLDNGASQTSHNIDIFSGEIRPIDKTVDANVPTKTGTLTSIYKLGSLWLSWEEDVDVARAPLSTSVEDRIYYSGHYNPKSTDSDLADASGTDYPTDWWRLGLPSPDTKCSLASGGGGSGVNTTRSYVYTYVTAWGEEGPPSPVSDDFTALEDDTWQITNMDAAPLNTGSVTGIASGGGKVTFTTSANHFLETGDYVLLTTFTGGSDTNYGDHFDTGAYWQVTRESTTTFSVTAVVSGTQTGCTWSREADINTTGMVKRIYRTTGGTYRYVDEVAVATTSYNDTKTDIELGEELQSTNWNSPPPDLKGLVNLPNGAIAGFKDNSLWVSELYVPHAFPPDYELTFPYPIVAIAASGSYIIVATEGNPFIVVGDDPANMAPTELEVYQSCVAKRSMVSIHNGAVYASPDGLVYVPVAGTPQIITERWYKKTDWDLLNPSSMVACKHDDRYYASYKNGGEDGNESRTFVFDPREPTSTVTFLTYEADGCHSTLEDDEMYFIVDNVIKHFGAGGPSETFTWRSKMHTMGRPVRFTAAQVKHTIEDGLTQSSLATLLAEGIVTLEAQTIIGGEYYVGGGFGAYSPSAYAVGGGPYTELLFSLSGTATLYLKIITGESDEQIYAVFDSKPFRVKVGDLEDIQELEVTGVGVSVHEVNIAETMSELAKL